MPDARRETPFLLAGPERTLLRAIARHLPRRVTSNHLTALGVVGGLGAAAGYVLSAFHPAWLALASVMIAVNWFGDSLDGTLARVRQAERPRYGYYLDHIVDAFTTVVVGVGIGLSPFFSLQVALVLVVLYLTLSINVYLESTVYGVFRLGYGLLGPTEVRIILIVGNAVLVGVTAGLGVPANDVMLIGNLTGVGLALLMTAVLAARFTRNLSRLHRLDPRPNAAGTGHLPAAPHGTS